MVKMLSEAMIDEKEEFLFTVIWTRSMYFNGINLED
jgi:hypothetical protein